MQTQKRRLFSLILTLMLLTGQILPLSACDSSDEATLNEILALIQAYLNQEKKDEDSETNSKVTLALTYPAGKSPNVFTSGWVFGARCTSNGTDISDQVRWSGTGSFSPDVGRTSRPSFGGEGSNTITLSVTVDGKEIKKTVNVAAVSSAGYASIGSIVHCPADAHGCPACPHPTVGKISSGSPNVLINGKPAARKGDTGVHAACCGPNQFTIVSGDPNVLINGKPAAKSGDATAHCGGEGTID